MTVQIGPSQRVKTLAPQVVDLVRRKLREPSELAEAASEMPGRSDQEVAVILQGIVDRQRKERPPGGLSVRYHKRLVHSWRTHFTSARNRASEIVEVLAICSHPDFVLDLRPPVDDLETQCQKVFFWRQVKGVQIVTPRSAKALSGRMDTLLSLLDEQFDEQLNEAYYDLCIDDALHPVPMSAMMNDLDVVRAQAKLPKKLDFTDEGLERLLAMVVHDVVSGHKPNRFLPALQLVTMGNLPLGLRGTTPVVLCADKRRS